MNFEMLGTDLYKIFSKKVVWISMAAFIMLFFALKIQMRDMVGVKYTLEPMRAELAGAVESGGFRDFVRSKNYSCSIDEIEPYIPTAVFEYIDQYKTSERIYNSLRSDLIGTVNNYFERTDNREEYISRLADDAANSDRSTLARAKAKLLSDYQKSQVKIELNLESSANNFIDVNHSAVFPGLIMLVIIVGLAGIYSDEYISGMQSALLTSKKGRKDVFFSKLSAAFIFITAVVAVMEISYMIITAVCYHAPKSSISAASTYGLSLTPFGGSVRDFCLRQVLGTLLAGYTLGSIVMCISAFSKNALIPFFAAGLFYGGTALYANAIALPPILSSTYSLPAELSLFMLQTQYELAAAGHYTSVFGILLPTPAVNAVFNACVALICLIITYKAYTRKQVKG